MTMKTSGQILAKKLEYEFEKYFAEYGARDVLKILQAANSLSVEDMAERVGDSAKFAIQMANMMPIAFKCILAGPDTMNDILGDSPPGTAKLVEGVWEIIKKVQEMEMEARLSDELENIDE